MKDVRPEVTVDRTYATKFMAAHYLSWNVSKRWNLGFFESVVWGNDNNCGFDAIFGILLFFIEQWNLPLIPEVEMLYWL
jgi:hypothetical protein